jgi:hypothetical protein
VLVASGLMLIASGIFFVAHADVSSVSVSVISAQCSDGADNDGDLLIDYPADSGCLDGNDTDESNAALQCADTLDNDGDGLTDYPSDPGCDSVTDNNETNLPASGGGGGGGIVGPGFGGASVVITGYAYPNSVVRVYQDGREILQTIAGPNGLFNTSIQNILAGIYTFSINAQDKNGRRSPLYTVPISVSGAAQTTVSGVYLAPTLSADLESVKRGETITFFGQTLPNAPVTIYVNSVTEVPIAATSSSDGVYLSQFNSSVLEEGDHAAKSQTKTGSLLTPHSASVAFSVSSESRKAGVCAQRGDVNGDGKVTMVDFSIAAFWYKRTLSATFSVVESQCLTGDEKIDLRDFSIMAYYWTGR